MNYLTQLVNQILTRRRERLERRNDFIQIMVDHEEDVKQEQTTNKQEQQQTENQNQQWGILKKSNNSFFKNGNHAGLFDVSFK